MGIPIDGPTNMFVDNKSVVCNVKNLISPLNSRHNTVVYHKCHEEVATRTAHLTHDSRKENGSDRLTKILVGTSFCKFYQYMMTLIKCI